MNEYIRALQLLGIVKQGLIKSEPKTKLEFEIVKQKSAKEKFRTKLYSHYKKMGYTALVNSMEEVYKYLRKYNGKVNDNTVKQVEKIIQSRYIKELKKTKKYIKPLMSTYYPSQKKNYRIHETKCEIVKETIGYDLTGIDYQAINLLSQADILWIGNHSGNTKISRTISKFIQDNIEVGLTGQEISGLLKKEFADYAPKEFIKQFGESAYWSQVVNNNVTRTSAISKINSMSQANITQYQWLTRETERTCEYCNGQHLKIYNVLDATDMVNNFYDKVKDNDIEGMKNAMPFLTTMTVEQSKNVPVSLVPAHPECECVIVIA